MNTIHKGSAFHFKVVYPSAGNCMMPWYHFLKVQTEVVKLMSKMACFILCHFYHVVDISSTTGGFSIFSKYFRGLNFH